MYKIFLEQLIFSSAGRIQEASLVSWIEKYSNPLALLHCILNYPTLDENANLGMIKGLKKAFPEKVYRLF